MRKQLRHDGGNRVRKGVEIQSMSRERLYQAAHTAMPLVSMYQGKLRLSSYERKMKPSAILSSLTCGQ